MTDLDRLIEAVEAGFPEWGLLEADGLIDGDNAVHFRDAFSGSLDAAKRLHEALLPGWAASVKTEGDPADHWHAFVSQNRAGQVGDSETPARAWLLAILKAYRSTP